MADTTTDSTGSDLSNLIMQQLLRGSGSNTLTDLGQILGGAAAGRASGRATDAQLQLAQGALLKSLYDASLNRSLTQAALPNLRAKEAYTGDLMANVQDSQVQAPANVQSHVVNFTGGLRPSALGPNARAAGATLSNIGASNIGKDVLPEVPNAPNLPQSNWLDSLLGGAGLGSSILGALAKGAGGSGGSSSGGDIGKLISNLLNRGNSGRGVTGPNQPGNPNLSGSDTGNLQNDSMMFPLGPDFTGPTDPSGGTGVGPGMQDYYAWLQSGGGDNDPSQNWGDE